MDRDKRWERTEKYFDCITLGQAEVVSDPVAALEESYKAGITDEFITPKIVVEHGEPLDACAMEMWCFGSISALTAHGKCAGRSRSRTLTASGARCPWRSRL